jgi:formyl-CoA transferase
LDRTIGAQPLSTGRLLDSASLPYGVVQIRKEIVNDPQLHANKIIVPIANGGGARKFTVDSPFTIEEQPKAAPKVAPGLGEQTLHELGFEATQINSLRTDGVVPANPRRESPAAD